MQHCSHHLYFVLWFISMFNSMNIMSPTNMATAENRPFYTSLLPSILTSTFLPHWEDIWSPTRPALCNPPPLPPSLTPSILSTPLSTCRDPLRHRAKNSSDPPLASSLSQRSLETNDAHCVISWSTGITIWSIWKKGFHHLALKYFGSCPLTAVRVSIDNIQLSGYRRSVSLSGT